MIEKMFIRSSWHYNMENVEEAICKTAGPCQIQLLVPQTDFKLVDNKWMSESDLLQFLDWYAEVAPTSYGYAIQRMVNAVKKDQRQKRANSKKWRWHVAYRQDYKCLHCKEKLHPDSLDIDHIEELRQGGLDELSNLCALCSNCHAKKTRSYHRRHRSK